MSGISKFKDFFSMLASIRGDIANVTSPPSFLAPQSVVEISTCWLERPSLFAAPALEPDPQLRALLVAKWIIGSLRTQFYVGQNTSTGLKKPLNAFLGELFIAKWTDATATVHTTTEQVSHHPPITACAMWDDQHGIRGEGYSRVEMTFNGSLNIKQTGHAMLHIDEYGEDHLIPFPHFSVKGFLSGTLYPEISGTYYLISSSGFVTELRFSGKGYFSGKKNSLEAVIYRRDDDSKTALYVIRGQWSRNFTVYDGDGMTELETWDPQVHPPAPIQIADVSEQDPWETRRAWRSVISALRSGDLAMTLREKSKLEEAQREMRRKETAEGRTFEPVFFKSTDAKYPAFEQLASATDWKLQKERTKGVWVFDKSKAEGMKNPFRGDVTPLG